MKICKDGQDICTPELWMKHAPPKGADHEKVGRSAWELAQAWCDSLSSEQPPPAILTLLEQYTALVGASYGCFEPECRVRFDTLRGEPRNADLVGVVTAGRETIAISIEGKADEPFDLLVADRLRLAAETIAGDERTFLPQRIQELGRALLPKWTEELPHLGDLRYQLLTGVAGTLAFAKEKAATAAIFIVHEFRTSETDDDLLERNQKDLDRFIWRLTAGRLTSAPADKLLGPFSVRGNRHIPSRIPLFIGKATQDLLTRRE